MPAPYGARAYAAVVFDAGGVLVGARDGRNLLPVVSEVRAAGLRTALLTNADRDSDVPPDWRPLFDAVVVSGEVGLRKPDPRAYALVADRLGVPPTRCVMVDDLAENCRGAVAAGMAAVRHGTYATTLDELRVLLQLPLEGCV